MYLFKSLDQHSNGQSCCNGVNLLLALIILFTWVHSVKLECDTVLFCHWQNYCLCLVLISGWRECQSKHTIMQLKSVCSWCLQRIVAKLNEFLPADKRSHMTVMTYLVSDQESCWVDFDTGRRVPPLQVMKFLSVFSTLHMHKCRL